MKRTISDLLPSDSENALVHWFMFAEESTDLTCESILTALMPKEESDDSSCFVDLKMFRHAGEFYMGQVNLTKERAVKQIKAIDFCIIQLNVHDVKESELASHPDITEEGVVIMAQVCLSPKHELRALCSKHGYGLQVDPVEKGDEYVIRLDPSPRNFSCAEEVWTFSGVYESEVWAEALDHCYDFIAEGK